MVLFKHLRETPMRRRKIVECFVTSDKINLNFSIIITTFILEIWDIFPYKRSHELYSFSKENLYKNEATSTNLTKKSLFFL